jgi:hypothetical protein
MHTVLCWQAALLRGLTDPEAALRLGISLAFLHAAEGMLVSAGVLDQQIISALEAVVRLRPSLLYSERCIDNELPA